MKTGSKKSEKSDLEYLLIGVGLVILSIMAIIGACSDDSTEEKASTVTEEAKNTQEPSETSQQINADNGAQEEKEKAERIADQEAEAKQLEVKAYAHTMAQHVSLFSEGLRGLEDGAIQLEINPYIVTDNNWVTSQATALLTMQDGINEIQKLTPPEDDTLKSSHSLLLLAMDEYQKVVELYPDAIDNRDVSILNQVTNHLEMGSSHLKQATARVDEYMENRDSE